MLLGFRGAISRSSRHIMGGRSTGKQLLKMLVLLFLMLLLHILAMLHFEEMPLGDAIWLTMTSATTVGYGDLSAHTMGGRISTVILLYIGGIAILAQVISMYFEYMYEIKSNMLKGNWSWSMKNHVVFLNCPGEVGDDYFYKAISGMRKSHSKLAKLPIVIVSEKLKGGISDRLRNLNVVHVSKSMARKETLESASVKDAHTIVILSRDRFVATSDSINFELVDRLRSMGVKARIIAEVVEDENRERLKKVGADNVVRPIRTYPELLMRSILAPGSEQVIETLFDSSGEECIRYDMNFQTSWYEIVQKLAYCDYGLPIAYENTEGKVINNPSSKAFVNAKALFIITNEDNIKTPDEVRACLNRKLPQN